MTTTNKDDLVSYSPTRVRHTLRPQDVRSIWCCLCPEMVCPTVCLSVCTRESHYLFRPKRAGSPQVVFVDQSAALLRLVIDHLHLPTAVHGAHCRVPARLLAKELTGWCDCYHTSKIFWFYRQMMTVQNHRLISVNPNFFLVWQLRMLLGMRKTVTFEKRVDHRSGGVFNDNVSCSIPSSLYRSRTGHNVRKCEHALFDK